MNPASESPGPKKSQAQDRVQSQVRWSSSFRGMMVLVWRQKLSWRQWPTIALTLFTLPVFLFATMKVGHAQQYFYLLIGLYLQLVLPFYCLTVFGDLIQDELQAKTLVFLTTRPLTRVQLFLLKFFCLWTWVELLMFVQAVLLIIAGWAHEVSGLASLFGLLVAAQFLAILVFGALSALFGVLQRRFLVLGLLYGLIVEVGIGQIPTNLNTLSMMRHIKTIMGNNPNLRELLEWAPQGTYTSVAAMVIAAAVFLALGATLFTYKELLAQDNSPK
jgi:ABC-type transport system involved in multi-copper enzyme maturation permease subunit